MMHRDLYSIEAADLQDDEQPHERHGHDLFATSRVFPAATLKASEARYRRLFEAAEDGIMIIDTDTGVIVDANPFLENLLGFDHEELVGRAVWEIDAFGHEAGDHLPTQVGAVFDVAMRRSDIACRYGGEEFVLVFPETTLDDLRRRVEEIRAMSHGLALRHDDRLLGTITMSAGLALAPEHGSSARELIAAADAAMYTAKREGRNRMACCDAQATSSRALIVIETPDPRHEHGPGSTSLVAWRPEASARCWPG